MPETSTPGCALVERFFASARSLDDYVSFFAEDAVFRFANYPPVAGRDGIRAAAERMRQRVQRVAHKMIGMWEQDNVVVCEMEVTYTRLDGKEVSVPCCDTFRLSGDHLQEMRVYVDVTPVFS